MMGIIKKGKGGKPYAAVVQSNKSRAWERTVRKTVGEVDPKWDFPVGVQLLFCLPKPKSSRRKRPTHHS